MKNLHLLLIFLFLGCGSESEKQFSRTPASFIEGFRLIHSRDGLPVWRLEAQKTVKEDSHIRMEKPVIRFFKGERITAEISSAAAFMNEENESVRLEGSVEVRDFERETELYLEELIWDPADRKFRSFSSVRKVTPQAVITGKGLLADEGWNEVVILEKVQVQGK